MRARQMDDAIKVDDEGRLVAHQFTDLLKNLSFDAFTVGGGFDATHSTTTISGALTASDPRIPSGTSRCGFLVSCAAVEIASKPRYA